MFQEFPKHFRHPQNILGIPRIFQESQEYSASPRGNIVVPETIYFKLVSYGILAATILPLWQKNLVPVTMLFRQGL